MKTNKTDFGHLATLIEEDDRDQQILEGMTDVEAGHIIDHQAVQAWADTGVPDQVLGSISPPCSGWVTWNAKWAGVLQRIGHGSGFYTHSSRTSVGMDRIYLLPKWSAGGECGLWSPGALCEVCRHP